MEKSRRCNLSFTVGIGLIKDISAVAELVGRLFTD